MRLRLLVTSLLLLLVSVGSIAVVVGLKVASATPTGRHATSKPPTPAPPLTPLPVSTKPVVYLYYYLWWTPSHWAAKLGAKYPLTSSQLVPPGTMNAAGCNPQTRYPGATIVDLPQQGLYNQNQESVYELQIQEAVQAGVTGFLASWQGTGTATETTRSSGYNERLALLVRAVDAYDQAHPQAPFHLGLAMSAFGNYSRPASELVADLSYFSRTYGQNPAFRNQFSSHPIVVLMDSRKYSVGTVAAIWNAEHGGEYLVGDETAASWPRDQPYLNATSYYWSSENPWTNGRAQSDIVALGAEVHASGKNWFSPFIPGYDKQLVGGSCVPRDGVATMQKVWAINSASHPEGWFGISWNEFVENTYLQPSLRYGAQYLAALGALIQGSASG